MHAMYMVMLTHKKIDNYIYYPHSVYVSPIFASFLDMIVFSTFVKNMLH